MAKSDDLLSHPVGPHGFPLEMVQWCLRLVLEGCISLRAVPRVLELTAQQLGLTDLRIPHWTTPRRWLLRLGLAMLRQPLPIAKDWMWLVDHSVQIGTVKCLVIVGLRACDLPPVDPQEGGRPLTYGDLSLIALVPMTQANKATIHVELEQAVARTGVPQRILSDHGADIQGAVSLFQQVHPETENGYDAKHKLACLLRPRFENDPQWAKFTAALGLCKARLQQTPLAALTPPSQRSKSRYMNLFPLLKWGRRVLTLLDMPREQLPVEVDGAELHLRCGWLLEFRADLARWLHWHRIVAQTLKFLRLKGLSPGIDRELAGKLPADDPLVAQVVAFVNEQSAGLAKGQRRPASTEILESCFSKLKNMESLQSKNGFTRLVLSLGACLAPKTATALHDALTQTSTQDVVDWVQQVLGRSLQSLRDWLYDLADAKQKPGEKPVLT